MNICTMYLSKWLTALDLSGDITSVSACYRYIIVMALIQLSNLFLLILLIWHLHQNKFLVHMYSVNKVWHWFQAISLSVWHLPVWHYNTHAYWLLPYRVLESAITPCFMSTLCKLCKYQHRQLSPIKPVPRYSKAQLEHCSITTSIPPAALWSVPAHFHPWQQLIKQLLRHYD